jgi:xylan 1,4-beta-xylosidase
MAKRPSVPASVEPIVAGFLPDPSVCRVGDVYYLANSSFEYAPGVPIRTSTDLLSWTLVANALTTPQQFEPGHAAASRGIYAPTLRHHDGRFWLITTDVGREGQLVVSAEDAARPWSPARFIAGLHGIDPDLAWDEDGTCYVTYCAIGPDGSGIAQARVDLERGVALEEPRRIWSGTGLAFPEGPHLYRIGAWWYLLIAEGGTERGHAVSVARATSPSGPFEACPANPILTHRSRTHPVQNTGHADLVQSPDGSWAMVYLGVRPGGTTPWFHVNGRETFLAGVDWVDGWPVVDEERYALPVPDRSWTDAFPGPGLDPRWVSPGDGLARVAHDGGPGVVLTATTPADERDGLFARVTDRRWAFTADLAPGEGAASVVLRLDDAHACTVRVGSGAARAVLRIGPLTGELGAVALAPDADAVAVTVAAADSDAGPDEIVLTVDDGSGPRELGRFDGRYLSTEVAGGFTGRVVGVRPDRGAVRLRGVAYTALDAHPEA